MLLTKKEDIESADKYIDVEEYENYFSDTPIFYKKDFIEIYNNDFYLAKKVYDCELSIEDYFKIINNR